MTRARNPREAAAEVLAGTLDERRPPGPALKKLGGEMSPEDAAFLRELVFGVLRRRLFLEGIVGALAARPLRRKALRARLAILAGLYQIAFLGTPAHAAVSETVNAVAGLGFPELRGFANAILRGYLRGREEIDRKLNASPETRYSFPGWLISDLAEAWGDELEPILEASNARPPFTVRVNPRLCPPERYAALLAARGLSARPVPGAPAALVVSPPVNAAELPLFAEGAVFVQDAAAQLAAPLLDPRPGEAILDACAAPGGKTTHILELCPGADVVAADADADRLALLSANLRRLGQKAEVVRADAADPDLSWSPRAAYDKILIDAPCSATGVIRRHPDVKWLRTPGEIAAIAGVQRKILENMWRLLKPGGIMIYATCSIEPRENSLQIENFLARHPDCAPVPLAPDGAPARPGLQILPGRNGMDGFFYAKLAKSVRDLKREDSL